jgi:hypothetical protein
VILDDIHVRKKWQRVISNAQNNNIAKEMLPNGATTITRQQTPDFETLSCLFHISV